MSSPSEGKCEHDKPLCEHGKCTPRCAECWSTENVRKLVNRITRRELENGPFLAAFDAGLCDTYDTEPKHRARVRIRVVKCL